MIKELFEEAKVSSTKEEMALSSSATHAAVVQTLHICPPAFMKGKLDGTSYTLWKFKVTSILESYELLDVSLGIDVEAQSTPNPADPSVMIPPNAHLLRA